MLLRSASSTLWHESARRKYTVHFTALCMRAVNTQDRMHSQRRVQPHAAASTKHRLSCRCRCSSCLVGTTPLPHAMHFAASNLTTAACRSPLAWHHPTGLTACLPLLCCCQILRSNHLRKRLSLPLLLRSGLCCAHTNLLPTPLVPAARVCRRLSSWLHCPHGRCCCCFTRSPERA